MVHGTFPPEEPLNDLAERREDDVNSDELFEAALAVRNNSYSPYSNFPVGAAIRGTSGAVYVGTNVESSSLGLTLCAERTAIGALIAAGETAFTEVAVVADTKRPVPPCGACRQLLHEFGADAHIFLGNLSGARAEYIVRDLLPEAFTAADLKKS